jgi:flagellar biosynthesis/type III secretory pathway chaperone
MTPAQQQLMQVTATHIKSLSELEEVLHAEAEALGSRNLQQIQAATERKYALLNRLEGAGRELTELCREAGVRSKRNELAGPGVTSAMALAWSRMCELLERCEQKNRLNGVAIQSSRNFAENLLALLQGQQPAARTYGPQGTLHRDPLPQALGSA